MSDIDEIRQQMGQIRHDLHRDVSKVVNGVSDAMSWRSVLANHPWATVVSGMVLGYLVVPHRRGRYVQPEGLASMEGAAPPVQRMSLVGPAIRFVWPIAEQALQYYALHWVEQQIKQHLQVSQPPPEPAPPPAPAQPVVSQSRVYPSASPYPQHRTNNIQH